MMVRFKKYLTEQNIQIGKKKKLKLYDWSSLPMMIESGMNSCDIAKKVGCTPPAVRFAAKKIGKRFVGIRHDWSRLKGLVESGKTSGEIAEIIGSSNNAVRLAAKSRGIKTRNHSEASKKTWDRLTKEQRLKYCDKISTGKRKTSKYHGERVEIVCPNCNRKFVRMRSWVEQKVAFGNLVKNRYCSKECQMAHCLAIRWERDRKEYNTVAQRKLLCSLVNRWTRAVKKRDGYRCMECGYIGAKKDGILVAHHILDWCNNPEQRFEVENGTTLCQNCHKGRHKTLPKYSNWDKESSSETTNYSFGHIRQQDYKCQSKD